MLYQQFLVGVDEEESWLNEKTTLVSSDEVGDTLAAVQVSISKMDTLPSKDTLARAYLLLSLLPHVNVVLG